MRPRKKPHQKAMEGITQKLLVRVVREVRSAQADVGKGNVNEKPRGNAHAVINCCDDEWLREAHRAPGNRGAMHGKDVGLGREKWSGRRGWGRVWGEPGESR
jgi:hypothetical protein